LTLFVRGPHHRVERRLQIQIHDHLGFFGADSSEENSLSVAM
jgi:hypothetical protein